jgi:PAS domain S-box-containing protein
VKKSGPRVLPPRARAPRRSNREVLLRLATLARDSNDAVIVRDVEDRVVAWNAGAQKIYGYTEAEALGMSFRRLIPGRRRTRTGEWIRGAAPSAPIEIQRRRKDGRVLDVLLKVTVLRDEKGEPAELATTERDITERKHAERELRRLHARVVSAQETERKRVARELHDGVGQILSGVKLRLESLPGEIRLSAEGAAKLRTAGGALDRAIAEVRRVSQNLMPSELEDLGLESALRTLCREFKERAGVLMTVRAGPLSVAVPPEIGLAFFRVAQEALNNVVRHSRAREVSVSLSHQARELELSVSDDGIGFDPARRRPAAGRGIGLGNMRERAAAVGGVVEVLSTPGAGTMLIARAPLSIPKRGLR